MSSKTKTTATKEEAEPALVPKLRFPGFTAPWAYEPLSKVLKEHKLKNTSGRDVFSVSMEYGIVNQIQLLGRSFAAADTSHYTIGRRYDVVYTKSPLKAFPFGIVKQCKFDGEAALSPLYGVFTPPNPHLGLMIEAYFESPNRSIAFLTPLCQKGAKNTIQITNSTFLSGKLPLPTQPAEQQKIAEGLSSVDELMAAQARKVDALKTHKKGLMQQLFPREGETQPRLRFPEFQNGGEWEVKKLEDVGDFKNGVNFSAEKKGRGILTVDVLNMYGPGIEMKLDGLYRVDVEAGDYLLSGGDILFVRSSMKREGVGWASLFRGCSEPVIFCGFLIRLRLKSSNSTDPEFLSQYLRSPSGRGKIIDVSGTAAITNVSQDSLKGVAFPSPPLPEQQRIATCLSSLDALITAETQKLEALKTHKKGLMQQLFPSPEEVAG